MKKQRLEKTLKKHRQWVKGNKGGQKADFWCADLRDADLSGVNLRDADLRHANLRYAEFRCANLKNADLFGADLRDADLRYADLRYADLWYTKLRNANLMKASLRHADLRNANLKKASLRYADLRYADLRGADLRYADLRYADLRGADLSGVKGLVSSIDYIQENFEQCDEGVIVYKSFGEHFENNNWKVEEGSIIKENCNPCRVQNCGNGINFGTRKWVNRYCIRSVWKCLIKWEWLSGVVVPYGTNGKCRCERLKILEKEEVKK